MSFRLKTLLGLAIIQIIFSGVLTSREYQYFKQTSHEQLLQKGQTAAKLLATMTANAVLASDLATLDDLVSQALDNKGVIYARVRNNEGVTLSERGPLQALRQEFVEDKSVADAFADERLDLSHEIVLDGTTFGRAEIGLATYLINNAMRESLSRMVSTIAAEVSLLMLFGFLLGSYLTRQLSGLKDGANKIASGKFGFQIDVKGRDELAETAMAFNQMSRSLAEQRDKIRSQTKHLKEALTKEKELNELQRQFVSTASHEFRTPLAVIDGMAQRLLRQKNGLTTDDLEERIEKIRAAVGTMTTLMESTLSAARHQDGKVKINIETCDIGKLVTETCAAHQEVSKSHVITCDLVNLPETIQADTNSVKQVLTNLLSNAVKYAPEAPDIRVAARAEGSEVVIEVRDKGIGIDEEDMHRIGERYFRAQTSTGISGTGIGLNLVTILVEMHGGSFHVASTKGEGSTFTVRLPVAGPGNAQHKKAKVA